MTKYFITGANGQVGSQLVAQLQKNPTNQILATNSQELDISNKKQVFEMVRQFQPNIIINAAAYTAVDKAESETERSHAVNATGAENLALAADEIGAAILHISTDYVFDGKGESAYRETDPVAPQNQYGKSKLAGEIAVQAACKRHIILRTAWVFGEHGANFVKTMLRLGASRDSLGVVGDQFGSPTYAGDIARALIHISEKIVSNQNFDDGKFGIYHFSGSPYVSWYDFACEIFAQAQQQNILPKIPELKQITTADYPTPASRPANSRLDCTKIHDNFGIAPSDWRKVLFNLKDYV